jgi:hypothetical protein
MKENSNYNINIMGINKENQIDWILEDIEKLKHFKLDERTLKTLEYYLEVRKKYASDFDKIKEKDGSEEAIRELILRMNKEICKLLMIPVK